MLRIPYIQTQVSEVATTQLSSHLGVPVKIGNVDIEWFNRLVLEGLYLEDQDGKVMFEANHVAAGFEIMPLLEGSLSSRRYACSVSPSTYENIRLKAP